MKKTKINFKSYASPYDPVPSNILKSQNMELLRGETAKSFTEKVSPLEQIDIETSVDSSSVSSPDRDTLDGLTPLENYYYSKLGGSADRLDHRFKETEIKRTYEKLDLFGMKYISCKPKQENLPSSSEKSIECKAIQLPSIYEHEDTWRRKIVDIDNNSSVILTSPRDGDIYVRKGNRRNLIFQSRKFSKL